MITGFLIAVFNILKWLFVVYFFLSLLLPQAGITQLLRHYADLLLKPFRAFIEVLIPSSQRWPIDFSPILLFAVFQVLIWLLALLGKLV